MNTSREVLTAAIPAGSCSVQNTSTEGSPKLQTKQILVGWDKQRSWTFIVLSISFVVWACIFFPLMSIIKM